MNLHVSITDIIIGAVGTIPLSCSASRKGNTLKVDPGKTTPLSPSHLFQAFDHWIQVPQEKLAQIKEIIEMLHTASLLIDDVQDGSDLRRYRFEG